MIGVSPGRVGSVGLARIRGGGVAALVAQYAVEQLRASQPGFGSPIDQSGKYNDPQLNTALFPPTWQASQTVAAGAYRAPTTMNGRLYKATAGGGGATGAAEPTWPTIIGGTVVDGALTWTCERGPWYTPASGERHITSIRQALLPASGAFIMPPINWDMASGDSLALSFKLSFPVTDIRTDTSATVISNFAFSPDVKGFRIIFDGAGFANFRFSVGDGSTVINSAFISSSFNRKPLDGNPRSVVMMVDGQTKTMFAWIDSVAILPSDMNSNPAGCPNNLSLSTVTGSTAGAANFLLGAAPSSSSIDFGVTKLDALVLPARGLPANRQALAEYLAA